MCGILCSHHRDPAAAGTPAFRAGELAPLLATMRHRGPDSSASLAHGGAWLGHTRLAIIDLVNGDQPILNEDGTVAAILNGEIYNHRELRDDLRARGHVFRTTSDTEVLVHLYEEYGEDMFRHLLGMFAATVHDERTGTLLVARDRLGQKPVLYHTAGEALYVASELKALAPLLGPDRRPVPQALALFLNCMYVPAPLTIFAGIHKLPPAHYLKHDAAGLVVRPYWRPDACIDWSLTEAQAVDGIRDLLHEAVRSQLIADVPLGVFLSGGLDSGAVVASAVRAMSEPPATFVMGMGDGLDERPWARIVADHCGTRHRELWAGGRLVDDFALLMDHFDEPFADTSALPTFLLARAARDHVKVVLTGDGGDELLAGYDSYLWQARQRSTRFGSRLGRLLGRAGVAPPYPRSTSGPWPRHHWHRMRSVVPSGHLSSWLGTPVPSLDSFWRDHRWLHLADSDPLSIAFEHDFNYYLPDDLLKKVDMASMLTGLECRSPFLDHRLVEFCFRIPPTLKIAGGVPKHLLRRALADELPRAIIDRPKQGFGSPVRHWVQGPLRDLARDLLRPGCRCDEHLDPAVVAATSERFWSAAEGDDWRLPLQYWSLLKLEWWLRRWA